MILHYQQTLIVEAPGPTVSSKLQAPDFWDRPGNQHDISYHAKSGTKSGTETVTKTKIGLKLRHAEETVEQASWLLHLIYPTKL